MSIKAMPLDLESEMDGGQFQTRTIGNGSICDKLQVVSLD